MKKTATAKTRRRLCFWLRVRARTLSCRHAWFEGQMAHVEGPSQPSFLGEYLDPARSASVVLTARFGSGHSWLVS